MSIHVKLKKGANINLQGVPNRVLSEAPISELYALKPSDFHGVIPKLILSILYEISFNRFWIFFDELFICKSD